MQNIGLFLNVLNIFAILKHNNLVRKTDQFVKKVPNICEKSSQRFAAIDVQFLSLAVKR